MDSSELHVSSEFTELAVWHWLMSPDARRVLADTADAMQDGIELSVAKPLRESLGAAKATAIMRQVKLRSRARAKFADADRMLFTATGLAQATSDVIARYKSSRFGDRTVWDLCCGIGGDLRGLAARGPTRGFDSDPVTAMIAEFNTRSMAAGDCKVDCENVTSLSLPRDALLHVDPDRRAGRGRTVDPSFFVPDWPMVASLLDACEGGGAKLAPATCLSPSWIDQSAREWIGHRGECKQQMFWTGSLADTGWRRAATVVSHAGESSEQITSVHADRQSIAAGPLGRYLYEPHAAVLCAELVSELARQLDARPFSRDGAYLTGDRWEQTLLAAAFEVLDVLPLRAAAVEDGLRAIELGIKEIKTRGLTGVDLAAVKSVRYEGPPELTIVLTRIDSRPRALLCRRCG